MSNKGKVIIIVAPSGTGKSTLIHRILDKFDALEWSVSYTSRGMREGEVHGKDYFFISKEEFENKIKNEDFVEWALVHDDYKGTEKHFVQSKLDEGISILFDVDVQGADALKDVFKDQAKAIFIEPPSIEELRARLEKRASDTAEAIEKRMSNAKNELKRKNDYDYLIMNDDLETAYGHLQEIISQILERSC